ncbi:MAG: hypothetical protein ABI885_14785 [Gammaproteobacteria bacterium]
MSWIWPDGLTCLQGGGVTVEPLTLRHVDGLAEAAADGTQG